MRWPRDNATAAFVMRNNRSCLFWLLFLLIVPTWAVKDYLFKKCEQNGFCHRNRHYSKEIGALADAYEPRYSLDRSSFVIDESIGELSGVMHKQMGDGSRVDLTFQVSLVTDYSLRFQLDEKDRELHIQDDIKVNKKRHSNTDELAFDGPLERIPFQYQTLDDEIILIYGDRSEYKSVIKMYPFRITVFYNDVEQIILNDRDFMNIEHYRSKESEEDVNDHTDVLPEESRFNGYSDNFKDSKNDALPLGPESVALDFTFVNYTHVYGIPEHADSLSLKDTSEGEPYRLYNVDIFEYEVQSKFPMYGSIPLMIAVKPDVSSAIFWVNAADTYIDINKQAVGDNLEGVELIWSEHSMDNVKTHWMSENGIIDVILMVKPQPGDISKTYGEITGFTRLPHLFSLGYHQCRWNYNDETDVLDVHSNFDAHEIPYDTIWLDIEYTDNKKYFTWNKALFPDPDRMMSALDETKRQLVVIIDPHIKDGYYISEAISDKQIGIIDEKIDSTDKTYHGHCWPGDSVWIDSLNPNAQKFWDLQFQNGSSLLGYSTNGHLWNDMNEPSVFNGPETSAPKDLLHYDNFEHRSVHNVYGLALHEMTYNSLIKRNPNKRPFILTRSFFAGSQRTAAMWTGDNMAKWEYLKESIPMVLTMNIAGFPFAGADVGGFFGNPSKELLVRWYQTGIWYPFFRAHAHIDSRRREPWIAGGEYTDYMRDAIKLRYRLLPQLYTQFWKNSVTGEPIMKPLLWENAQDRNGYEIDNQFFMNGLLVHPVVDEAAEEVEVYFPCDGQSYYDFFDLSITYNSCQFMNVKATLGQIPVFIRGGSIITMKDRYRRSAQLMKYDPYTLYVVLGSDGKAEGQLYVDDGETFGYQSGDYLEVQFTADKERRTISGRVLHSHDSGFVKTLKDRKVAINKIVVVGANDSTNVSVEQNGKQWGVDVVKGEHDEFYSIRNPGVLITDDWMIVY
mgnify:CR=1 FL=1